MTRRLRPTLLVALLLALAPELASARATGSEEWPTASDRGARSPTRVPWLRFSGDETAPVLATVPGHAVHAHEVVVVREQELSRRQRRLIRRARRHAEKAAALREKAGIGAPRSSYAVVVPVAPVVQAAPPRTVVVERADPKVQVVHLERADEHEDCHESDDDPELGVLEHEGADEIHVPVVINLEELSADVDRQVERALRDVERAQERAGRARERAERSQRGKHRARR